MAKNITLKAFVEKLDNIRKELDYKSNILFEQYDKLLREETEKNLKLFGIGDKELYGKNKYYYMNYINTSDKNKISKQLEYYGNKEKVVDDQSDRSPSIGSVRDWIKKNNIRFYQRKKKKTDKFARIRLISTQETIFLVLQAIKREGIQSRYSRFIGVSKYPLVSYVKGSKVLTDYEPVWESKGKAGNDAFEITWSSNYNRMQKMMEDFIKNITEV